MLWAALQDFAEGDALKDDVGMSVVMEGRENEAGAKRLSRTVIARAAVSYIDRHGLQRLTMRGLGQELGVEAMALYRYVNGREDLLEEEDGG